MTSVLLICPECNEKGFIEVPEEEKNKSFGGLLAIDIDANLLCQHTIIAYIDANFQVRDCIIPDFKVELPELTLKDQTETKFLPGRDIFDIDLIKLNLPFTLLVHILKSIFFNEKIILISNQDYLYKHIYNFFENITQYSFGIDITIINQDEYKNNKDKYKDCVILEKNKILRDDNNIIDIKKLKVEKQIIKNFLSSNDLAYCYIRLKNEIKKAYELSKSIADKTLKFTEAEDLNQKIIMDFLMEEYQVEISKTYLIFLCEIAKNYFKVKDSRIFYPSNTLKAFWKS